MKTQPKNHFNQHHSRPTPGLTSIALTIVARLPSRTLTRTLLALSARRVALPDRANAQFGAVCTRMPLVSVSRREANARENEELAVQAEKEGRVAQAGRIRKLAIAEQAANIAADAARAADERAKLAASIAASRAVEPLASDVSASALTRHRAKKNLGVDVAFPRTLLLSPRTMSAAAVFVDALSPRSLASYADMDVDAVSPKSASTILFARRKRRADAGLIELPLPAGEGGLPRSVRARVTTRTLVTEDGQVLRERAGGLAFVTAGEPAPMKGGGALGDGTARTSFDQDPFPQLISDEITLDKLLSDVERVAGALKGAMDRALAKRVRDKLCEIAGFDLGADFDSNLPSGEVRTIATHRRAFVHITRTAQFTHPRHCSSHFIRQVRRKVLLVLGMCRNKLLGLDSDADTAAAVRTVLEAGDIGEDGAIFANFSGAVCTRKGPQCKTWPPGSPQSEWIRRGRRCSVAAV
jgi:hypothetical protein